MSHRKTGLWLGLITLAALALNLWLRLTPFDFVWAGRVPLERLSLAPLTLRDVPLNVLLFVPLGFGLAGLFRNHRRRRFHRLGGISEICIICGFLLLLSVLLEAAQLFLPARAPSVADVAANGLGALLGIGLYRAWAMGLGRALHRYATRRNLLLGLALYVLLAALLTGYLYRSVQLSNWDASFPLVVGNEAVGRRQWSGEMTFLTMDVRCDGAPVAGATYDFAGDAPFEDTGLETNAPPLVWRDGPATAQVGDGVTVGPGEWLATTEPLRAISSAARRCAHFRIETAVATADPTQRGPARIASISADAEQRNVTLGQERDALIIRLRTPAGGENGQKPEVLVPGVFADGQLRVLTVSYDAPILRVWEATTGQTYALSLAPGLAFFPGFQTENRYPVVMTGNAHRYDWAYWGIVVGLAVVLFGVPAVVGKRMNSTRTGTDFTD